MNGTLHVQFTAHEHDVTVVYKKALPASISIGPPQNILLSVLPQRRGNKQTVNSQFTSYEEGGDADTTELPFLPNASLSARSWVKGLIEQNISIETRKEAGTSDVSFLIPTLFGEFASLFPV